MRGEAMLEVGDAEVEALLQEGAHLQEGVLHQEGVRLQGVDHLQGEALLQDAEEGLMMEEVPGGEEVEEVEEVKTGALQEGDRLQGEVPLLVGALRHAVALLQEGALLLAEMRGAAMEVPGGEVVEEVEDLHQDVDLHLEGVHHHAAMALPAMRAHQTGGVIVQ